MDHGPRSPTGRGQQRAQNSVDAAAASWSAAAATTNNRANQVDQHQHTMQRNRQPQQQQQRQSRREVYLDSEQTQRNGNVITATSTGLPTQRSSGRSTGCDCNGGPSTSAGWIDNADPSSPSRHGQTRNVDGNPASASGGSRAYDRCWGDDASTRTLRRRDPNRKEIGTTVGVVASSPSAGRPRSTADATQLRVVEMDGNHPDAAPVRTNDNLTLLKEALITAAASKLARSSSARLAPTAGSQNRPTVAVRGPTSTCDLQQQQQQQPLQHPHHQQQQQHASQSSAAIEPKNSTCTSTTTTTTTATTTTTTSTNSCERSRQRSTTSRLPQRQDRQRQDVNSNSVGTERTTSGTAASTSDDVIGGSTNDQFGKCRQPAGSSRLSPHEQLLQSGKDERIIDVVGASETDVTATSADTVHKDSVPTAANVDSSTADSSSSTAKTEELSKPPNDTASVAHEHNFAATDQQPAAECSSSSVADVEQPLFAASPEKPPAGKHSREGSNVGGSLGNATKKPTLERRDSKKEKRQQPTDAAAAGGGGSSAGSAIDGRRQVSSIAAAPVAASKIAFIKTLLTRQRSPSPCRRVVTSRSPSPSSVKRFGAEVAHRLSDPLRDYFKHLMTSSSGGVGKAADLTKKAAAAEREQHGSGIVSPAVVVKRSELASAGHVRQMSEVNGSARRPRDCIVLPPLTTPSTPASATNAASLANSIKQRSADDPTLTSAGDTADDARRAGRSTANCRPSSGRTSDVEEPQATARTDGSRDRERSPGNSWKSTSELNRTTTAPLSPTEETARLLKSSNSLQQLQAAAAVATQSSSSDEKASMWTAPRSADRKKDEMTLSTPRRGVDRTSSFNAPSACNSGPTAQSSELSFRRGLSADEVNAASSTMRRCYLERPHQTSKPTTFRLERFVDRSAPHVISTSAPSSRCSTGRRRELVRDAESVAAVGNMNMSSPTSPTYGHFRWDVDDPDYDDVADYDDDDRIQTTRSAGQQPAKFGSGDLSSDGSDVVSPGERDVGELYERTKFERQLEQKIAVIEKERSTMISNMWKDFERRLFDGDAATMERDGGRREGRAAVAGRVESRDTLGRSGRPGPQDARTLGRRAIAAGYYRPYYDISSSAGKLSRQEIDRSLDELLVELAMTTAPDRTTSRLNAAISGVVGSNSGVRMRPRAASCNRKSGADERRRYENMAAVLTGKSRSHTQLSRTPSTQNGGGAAPPSGGGSQQLLDQVLLRQNQKQTEPQSPTARPLTCYMPVLDNSLDLRRFVETSGHCLAQCNQVQITSTTCHGYLSKLQSGKLRSWKRRWFVFDRTRRCLFYYSDKTESLRSTESGSGGGAIYFQSIQDVYVDHLRTSKSARPDSTFCVKTIDRPLYLMAPSPEAMRIWIDVIFTGAEAYQQYV